MAPIIVNLRRDIVPTKTHTDTRKPYCLSKSELSLLKIIPSRSQRYTRREILPTKDNTDMNQPYCLSKSEMLLLIEQNCERNQEQSQQQHHESKKSCRNMYLCFHDKQPIRHTCTGTNSIWEGVYDKNTNCIVHNSVSYKTPSGFAKAHYKKTRTDRESNANGWKQCEMFLNGKWRSIHKLSAKYNEDGLRISNSETGFWRVTYYQKYRNLWKAMRPDVNGSMITSGPTRGKFNTPMEAAIALREYCNEQNIIY